MLDKPFEEIDSDDSDDEQTLTVFDVQQDAKQFAKFVNIKLLVKFYEIKTFPWMTKLKNSIKYSK